MNNVLQFKQRFKQPYNPRMNASIQQVQSEWELSERIDRIKTSLERINALMAELMAKEKEDRG